MNPAGEEREAEVGAIRTKRPGETARRCLRGNPWNARSRPAELSSVGDKEEEEEKEPCGHLSTVP